MLLKILFSMRWDRQLMEQTPVQHAVPSVESRPEFQNFSQERR
jgi:hypothetical protein